MGRAFHVRDRDLRSVVGRELQRPGNVQLERRRRNGRGGAFPVGFVGFGRGEARRLVASVRLHPPLEAALA